MTSAQRPVDHLSWTELDARLRDRLRLPLPGLDAQLALAPRPRPGWRAGHLPADARPAAGLLLLFPKDRAPHLLLTVRGPGLAHHAAQVSLPGGRIEPGETVEQAALREAHEEAGVQPGDVRIMGALTPLHIPVSGYVLYPLVGVADDTPVFHPSPGEVDRIVEAPLEQLLDVATVGTMRIVREGVGLDVPCFTLSGERVWGATAMVLAELRWVLGFPLPRPSN